MYKQNFVFSILSLPSPLFGMTIGFIICVLVQDPRTCIEEKTLWSILRVSVILLKEFHSRILVVYRPLNNFQVCVLGHVFPYNNHAITSTRTGSYFGSKKATKRTILSIKMSVAKKTRKIEWNFASFLFNETFPYIQSCCFSY